MEFGAGYDTGLVDEEDTLDSNFEFYKEMENLKLSFSWRYFCQWDF